jgi:hypothetical protein
MSSEPMIIIEPCAGLGNRLLGLGSAYAVAKKLDRKLVVMWKREVGSVFRNYLICRLKSLRSVRMVSKKSR